MEVSKPFNTVRGLHVVMNPITGQLEGVPKVWISKIILQAAVDNAKTVTMSQIPS